MEAPEADEAPEELNAQQRATLAASTPEARARAKETHIARAALRRQLAQDTFREVLANYGINDVLLYKALDSDTKRAVIIDLICRGMKPNKMARYLGVHADWYLSNPDFQQRVLTAIRARGLMPALEAMDFLQDIMRGKHGADKAGVRMRAAARILQVTGVDASGGAKGPGISGNNVQVNIYGNLSDDQLRAVAGQLAGLDPGKLPASVVGCAAGDGAPAPGIPAPLASPGSSGTQATRAAPGPTPA